MIPVLETARLRLRPLEPGDYAYLRRMHADPRVMRYIAGGAERTEEETRRVIEKGLRLIAEHPGLGIWMIERKETAAVIGNILLRPPAAEDAGEGVEIGYSLETAHWGQGYASEACRALLAYARDRLGDPRIVALIDPEHADSRKLLLKLGFRAAGRARYRDPASGRELPSELLDYRGDGTRA